MQYTVLVVDDEQNQRRALIQKVDWEAAGFTVIGEAENGVEAIEKVEILEPDLIFTDIKMPMISGLELAAKVREISPITQIVILSGYDNFEYAQTAIQYNIIRYLLKPISSEELSKELLGIRKSMDEQLQKVLHPASADLEETLQRLSVTEFLLPLMLGSSEEIPNEDELYKRACELQIIKENTKPHFSVIITKFHGEKGHSCTNKEHISFLQNILSDYVSCESFLAYGRIVTLVICEKSNFTNALGLPLRELTQSAKKILNQECTIGVSRWTDSLSQCSAMYLQAVTARRYTSDGTGEIRFIEDQERDSEFELDRVEKNVFKLEQLLKVGEKDELIEFINSLYSQSTPENADLFVMQIVSTIYRSVSSVADKSTLLNLIHSNTIFARMTSYSSERVIRSELLELCTNAKDLITQSQKRDTEVLCDKVIQIIDKNFGDEELSLTSVSNELGVSPNYLSSLIKKTTKKNFITLVTERRMKEAYDLLLCSTMKILEVAYKCGYNDQHYFSYCFKKYYGESPNKIRAKTRGGDV